MGASPGMGAHPGVAPTMAPMTAPGRPGGETSDAHWADHATDTIVRTVDSVRERTSGPAITAVAGLVYGIVAIVALSVIVILLTAATIRGLELLLWRKVWLAYLVLSVACLAGGLVCWSRRATPTA